MLYINTLSKNHLYFVKKPSGDLIYNIKETNIMKTKIKQTKASEWISSKKDEKIYITKLEKVEIKEKDDFWGFKK